MDKGSFTDLYSVFLKSTYDMRVGNREIKEGETIAVFDNIQASGLTEGIKTVTAKGGLGNAPRVYWETPTEISLNFTQGVFNKTQFGLMVNSQLLQLDENTSTELTFQEALESDENGKIKLKYTPIRDLYIYKTDGSRITDYKIEDKTITISAPYVETIVNYVFEYTNGGCCYKIGAPLTKGFLSLEGRTRVKDEETGQVVTGIIKIPKLKLLSNFSIRLGKQSNPVLGKFNAVGIPVGSRDQYVMEFYILDDDIESDI